MKEKYIHIDVLFGQILPEHILTGIENTIYEKISKSSSMVDWQDTYFVDSSNISESAYLRAARSLKGNARRTEDELIQRYRDLKNRLLSPRPQGGFFALLDEYSRDILCYRNSEPLCRQEWILDWRERSLSLGQDLFTCAGLAARDAREQCITNHFSWPAIIHTDNLALQQLLQLGISENHFHLNGSTRMFSLCWCYLMNHPEKAGAYFKNKRFWENLYPTTSYGELDNQLPWHHWIYIAAWIRATLFERISTQSKRLPIFSEFHQFYHRTDCRSEIHLITQQLLYNAARLPMRKKFYALDYAITEDLLQNNSSSVRLLTGERYFMYQCFLRFFSDQEGHGKEEQDLFYLYLLIKTRFRRELIQSNAQLGFRNFSRYEIRKAFLWGNQDQYWEETYALSVGAAFDVDSKLSPVQSLEMRIMPRRSAQELYREIRTTDLSIQASLDRAQSYSGTGKGIRTEEDILYDIQENANYFYVLHFSKEPLEPLDPTSSVGDICESRNNKNRILVEQQAKATASALLQSSYLCSRIRGIDACTHEIGCRPETFATAFRFLRHLNPISDYGENIRYWPQIDATYHVGEDFLDLTDGLRAIDEAVCFLNMERGDRLGHALALGTAPEQYYRTKDYCVYLPAQDLLDNLVWILYRSLEWNVPISSDLRAFMERRAEQLLDQIYQPENSYTIPENDSKNSSPRRYTLREYFSAWRLRGDDPSIYKLAHDNPKLFKIILSHKNLECSSVDEMYRQAKLDEQLWDYGSRMNLLLDHDTHSSQTSSLWPRFHSNIQELMYRYHFGVKERVQGQEIERFEIGAEYIHLIRNLQNCMMQKIMQKGIFIECNPSSNKLIGTFDLYENHPLFRFNHVGLPEREYPDERVELLVSVNTDDQGIFDTSIENEYALIYGCLHLRKDENGIPLVDASSIRSYLNQLRELGNHSVFPKSVRCASRKYRAR